MDKKLDYKNKTAKKGVRLNLVGRLNLTKNDGARIRAASNSFNFTSHSNITIY